MDSTIFTIRNILSPGLNARLDHIPHTPESLPYINFIKQTPIDPDLNITVRTTLEKVAEVRSKQLCPLFDRIETGLEETEELLTTIYEALLKKIAIQRGSVELDIGTELFVAYFKDPSLSTSSSPELRLSARVSSPSTLSGERSPSSLRRTVTNKNQ